MLGSMVAQPRLILNLIFTFHFQSFSLKLYLQLLIQKFDIRLHSLTFVTKGLTLTSRQPLTGLAHILLSLYLTSQRLHKITPPSSSFI